MIDINIILIYICISKQPGSYIVQRCQKKFWSVQIFTYVERRLTAMSYGCVGREISLKLQFCDVPLHHWMTSREEEILSVSEMLLFGKSLKASSLWQNYIYMSQNRLLHRPVYVLTYYQKKESDLYLVCDFNVHIVHFICLVSMHRDHQDHPDLKELM